MLRPGGWAHIRPAPLPTQGKPAGAAGGDAPPSLSPEAAAEAAAALEEARSRYAGSVAIKADFHDAAIALAQHAYERGRLLSMSGGSEADMEALFKQSDAEFTRILPLLADEPAAPAAPGGEAEPSIRAQVQARSERVERAEGLLRADAVGRRRGGLSVCDSSHSQVMHGNVLFEHSQVRARNGKDWEKLLDEAVGLFNKARRRAVAGSAASSVCRQRPCAWLRCALIARSAPPRTLCAHRRRDPAGWLLSCGHRGCARTARGEKGEGCERGSGCRRLQWCGLRLW